MMGFQFAAGRRQAAFNNFLMEAWRPSSAPAANVETLILTGVTLKISYSISTLWVERRYVLFFFFPRGFYPFLFRAWKRHEIARKNDKKRVLQIAF